MSRTLLTSSLLKAPLRHHRLIPTTTLVSTMHQRHASDYTHLQTSLPERKIPLTHDYLAPTPAHLLTMMLNDLLPAGSAPPLGTSSARTLASASSAAPLPPAYHLIYFPPAIPGTELLPDGTDPLQSPGEPFVQRMWAGGALRINNAAPGLLALDGKRAVVMEGIRDVAIKGKEGDEKIFVGIERRVGRCEEGEAEDSIRSRLWRDAEEDFGEAGAVERRNIVFMRERSQEQGKKDAAAAKSKKLEPPSSTPDFSHSLTPTPKILFRYSALTWNAHAIHLDPQYCREVEGHRDLLVHGPLSFTLMVTMLNAQLGKNERLKSIEYRNLSPLYCNEPLKICGKKKEEGKWDVWAETPDGGVGVKGTVKTETV